MLLVVFVLYSCFLGLPSFFPFLTALRSPSLVLSDMRFLSNSANAESIWNCSLPVLLDKSIPSLRLTKSMFLSCSSVIS